MTNSFDDLDGRATNRSGRRLGDTRRNLSVFGSPQQVSWLVERPSSSA